MGGSGRALERCPDLRIERWGTQGWWSDAHISESREGVPRFGVVLGILWWGEAKHLCRKRVFMRRGMSSNFQTLDFGSFAMIRRIRSVGRLLLGAPAAGRGAARRSVARVAVGLAAMVAVAGLAGCYGRNYYYAGGGQEYSGNNALWVANGTDVVEFLPSQLTSGTSDPTPHVTIQVERVWGSAGGDVR